MTTEVHTRAIELIPVTSSLLTDLESSSLLGTYFSAFLYYFPWLFFQTHREILKTATTKTKASPLNIHSEPCSNVKNKEISARLKR